MVPALVFLGFYHLVSFFMMPVLQSIDMHVFVFKIVVFILNNQDFSTNFFGFLFNFFATGAKLRFPSVLNFIL